MAGKYKCLLCEKEFISESGVKYHINSAHAEVRQGELKSSSLSLWGRVLGRNCMLPTLFYSFLACCWQWGPELKWHLIA